MFDKGWGGILFPILHNSPLGGSTLITSAPKSDRMTAAPGPAMKLARSTTFNPEKIFSVMFSVVISVFFFGLASLELGGALLQKRLRAFLFVLRSRAESEERSFERQTFGLACFQTFVYRLKRVLHRERGVGENLF